MKSILAMLVTVVALSLANNARAQEQAFANRASELKDRPANDARTIAPVAAEAPVKVLARQGAWTQVETGGQRGWMRVFHLRFPSTVESGGGGALWGLSGVNDNSVGRRGRFFSLRSFLREFAAAPGRVV